MNKTFVVFTAILVGLFLFLPAQAFQPFPDTGQTTCFDNEKEIPCPSPGQPFYGQDAQYQPRFPRSYTKLGYGGAVLSDDALHVDNGGQWIMTRDNVTGLIWELKTNANMFQSYSVDSAENIFIAGLNSVSFGGFSDWRLPDIKELSSLSIPVWPKIDKLWFQRNNYYSYWSSTTDAADIGKAWRYRFDDGSGLVSSVREGSYCVRAVRSELPSQQNLIDNLDGTVSDESTGLMWQQCNYGQTWEDGQCTGNPQGGNWQFALEAAQSLVWAGYSDWRLPNKNELQSLVDYSRANSAINPVFPNTIPARYWSSTTEDILSRAWFVDFLSGALGTDIKQSGFWIRAVRVRSGVGSSGSLSVTITPEAAIDAGAKWRRMGTTDWLDSGHTEHDLNPQGYTVEFKTIPGWDTPANAGVTVNLAQTALAQGLYVENTNTYDVTAATASQGGSVTGSGTFVHNTWVTLTAVPDSGYEFLHWTEDGQVVSTDADLSFLATKGRVLEAHFKRSPTFSPGTFMLLLE